MLEFGSSPHKMTHKVHEPMVDTSTPHRIWVSSQIGSSLIWIAFVNHENCHFKFTIGVEMQVRTCQNECL